MIRAFEVRTSKEALVYHLARDLDAKLEDLQTHDWRVISVVATPVKEYDYPHYFDSTLFTIIAENVTVEENE